MELLCPVLTGGKTLPKAFTCMGENTNPPLIFKDIPQSTKSLVLVFEDTDATPVPWVHWLVFNIPPTTTTVNEGEIPNGGTQGLANNNTFGYEGPCPKYFAGTHRYYWMLFALSQTLDIPAASDKDTVLTLAETYILETATLLVEQTGTKQ